MRTRWLCPLLLLGLPATAQEGRLRRNEPTWLSPAARRTIRARMGRHEARVSELVWAVMLRDYPVAERTARAIADAPPPLSPSPELKQLTPDFFAGVR